MQAWSSVLGVSVLFVGVCDGDEAVPARKILVQAQAPVVAAPVADATPKRGAPTCPEQTWAQRFAGQVAGLGWISFEKGDVHVRVSVPGERPAGPGSLPPLTVIRKAGRMDAVTAERSVMVSERKGQSTTVALEFMAPAPFDDRVAFVTTACVPNADAQLRVWSWAGDMREMAPDFDALKPRVDRHVSESLGPGVRSVWDRSVGVMPAGLGSFTSRIPGCARLLVVNADLSPRLGYDFMSAVLCVGDDANNFKDVMAPLRNRFIREVGVVDLDGDGVEEVVVRHQTHDSRGQAVVTTTDLLLTYEPRRGEFAQQVLSFVEHG